jgi:hypothetical protein
METRLNARLRWTSTFSAAMNVACGMSILPTHALSFASPGA